jgi:hypothetical protein
MAVILDPKPRVRLPAGDFPEPKIVRSRSWLPYYAALWVGAVIIGHGVLYGWLPFGRRDVGPALGAADNSQDPNYKAGLVARREPDVALVQPVTRTAPKIVPVVKPAVDLDELPSCEALSVEEQEHPDPGSLLPVDLSRTPLGSLLDFPHWTTPCRARRSLRVHLCLAVKNGTILGATARADPRDTSLERCIIRAASLVALEPEDALRKVQLDVDVPAERFR